MSLFSSLQTVVCLASFVCTCAALLESRFSRRATCCISLLTLAGVLFVQASLLLAGEPALVLMLAPVTVYLPLILCLHILSARGFFQTCAVWSIGCLVSFIMEFLRKLLLQLFARPPLDAVPSPWVSPIILTAMLLAAGGLLYLVFHTLRAPFCRYIREAEDGWLTLLFPTLLSFLLLSYYVNSAVRPTALLFILLTALSIFLILSQVLSLAVSLKETRAAEQAAQRQLELQRRDYDAICQKIEMGRVYRHDMRHHLTALDGMLQRSDTDGARQYIQDLNGKLAGLVQVAWCSNAPVNAVLGAYLAQANACGCRIDAGIHIPAELDSFDATDLCVILSNALENAIHACQPIPESERWITIHMELSGNQRLSISVENPCPTPVPFGPDGLPALPSQEGHGLGLRSIQSAVDRYHGLFSCQWEAGRFLLRAVLFPPASPSLEGDAPAARRRGPGLAAGVIVSVTFCLAVLYSSPTLANALEDLPLLGPIVRLVNPRNYGQLWGGSGLTAWQPAAVGSEAQSIQSEVWIAQMTEHFLGCAGREYAGYAVRDARYTTLRDDRDLLVLRFSADLSKAADGSVDYSRCITLDKAAGRVLELADLFLPEANYTAILSREITAQMAAQSKTGEGSYFLPGGSWPEDTWFRSVGPDQDFYINADGNLVIVFAENTVAPSSMGSPEFAIPTDLLHSLLIQPSLLQ